jgi:hypothetical protein
MFAVRYDMQNMPLCMQNTPAICANEVIGSSAGLVPINGLLGSEREHPSSTAKPYPRTK